MIACGRDNTLYPLVLQTKPLILENGADSRAHFEALEVCNHLLNAPKISSGRKKSDYITGAV